MPFILPKRLFLSCLIDVTHISEKNTSFVTSTGQNHREIKHETMFHALGPAKAAALPAFHVSDGAGNTGCFSESLLEKERHPAGKRPYEVTKMKSSVAF